MADDDNRPSPVPPAAVPMSGPMTEAGAVPGRPEALAPLPGEPDAIPAREPSMASGAADAAHPENASEPFAPTPSPAAAAPRRALMPALLAGIGVILIGLLAANLYMLANPPANDAVPALQGDVATLKRRLGTVDLAPLQAQLTRQNGDIAALKAAVAKTADASGAATGAAQAAVAPLAASVADLGKRVDGVAATVAALPKVDLGPVEARLAEIDKRLMPLEAYFNAPKSTVQVTDARQNGSAAQSRAAPVALIAGQVQAALAAGRPFETEVKALGNLGVDAATLQPLQAVAATGAATDASLAEGFAAVQDKIVVAAAPVSTGSMFDRMLANAQGIVKVTRTGAGTGGTADAVASRIAAALKAGDLKGAAAEWDRLPPESQQPSAAWAARLKARIAADAAARTMASAAVDALAAAP